ncbi:hypothetical protein MTBLM5_20183 [Magnetospirillum sp. LM-5]|nr:hypothetical protein MTBLM5_20183 [Magnetospirillum sp. LM-5]
MKKSFIACLVGPHEYFCTDVVIFFQCESAPEYSLSDFQNISPIIGKLVELIEKNEGCRTLSFERRIGLSEKRFHCLGV